MPDLVFGGVFAFAYTSMQPIYPAEVMTNDMRAKGMFLMQWTSGAAGMGNFSLTSARFILG